MIRLTEHGERRAAERGIQRAWIEAAVLSPDRSETEPATGLTHSLKAIPDFGGRVLRVVHRPDGTDALVVTVYFDRGAKQ